MTTATQQPDSARHSPAAGRVQHAATTQPPHGAVAAGAHAPVRHPGQPITQLERNIGRSIASELYAERFAKPREARSAAYKLGARHALETHLAYLHRTPPFAPGTAQRDAYLAGYSEGRTAAKTWGTSA